MSRMRDIEINAFDDFIKDAKDWLPYHYFVTTKFKSWNVFDYVRSDTPDDTKDIQVMEDMAYHEARVLARSNKSHVVLISGANDARNRLPHWHSAIASEKPLDFSVLKRFHGDYKFHHVQNWNKSRHATVYTLRKHLSITKQSPWGEHHPRTTLVHPRFRGKCSKHTCELSLVLRRVIPK